MLAAASLWFLSQGGCALSHARQADVELNDPQLEPPPETDPEPQAEPPQSCSFVDADTSASALLSFLGTELHRFGSDGESEVLFRFTGEGAEATAGGSAEFVGGEIATAGEYIFASGVWVAGPGVRPSQELAMIRDGVLVWHRIFEAPEFVRAGTLDDNGFFAGARSDGDPQNGIWIEVNEDDSVSSGEFPPGLWSAPFPDRTLLVRECEFGGECTQRWWQNGIAWPAMSSPPRIRLGNEMLRIVEGALGSELWLESPTGRRQVSPPQLSGTFSDTGFAETGTVLLNLDPPARRFGVVDLLSGEYFSVDDTTVEDGPGLLFRLALDGRGAVLGLFRQAGDTLVLARSIDGREWEEIGSVFPTGYQVTRFERLRGDTLLFSHLGPDLSGSLWDLGNALTGDRFPIDTNPRPHQLTQNGACFASWSTREGQDSALEVLSLVTGERRHLSTGRNSPVLWVGN